MHDFIWRVLGYFCFEDLAEQNFIKRFSSIKRNNHDANR